jgi:hypothetical protein
MAAGTPVIALRRGSVPEVIEDGVTGFICEDADEMVEATARIGEIDPDACRRQAEKFSARAMSRGYVDVYERLVAVPPASDRLSVPRQTLTGDVLEELDRSSSLTDNRL